MKASLWLAAHKLMRCTTCAPPVDKLIMRECEEGDNNNAIMVNKDMICGLTPKTSFNTRSRLDGLDYKNIPKLILTM